MRYLIPSWIRVSFLLILFIGLIEFLVDSGEQMAVLRYPILFLIVLVMLLFLIAGELCIASFEKVMFRALNTEAQERYLLEEERIKAKYSLRRIYHKLMGSKPISEERDLELDHNYDGIKELDNTLPPWWLYSFYASIVFAAGYLVYYHFLGGTSQLGEFEQEMLAAKMEVEAYKKNNPDLINADNVVLLTEPSDLEAGKNLFQTNCMACHAPDGGGGIGPNLTDEYWILGGGIKNIFHTISEGGRDGKGMVAWKASLRPIEVQQLASYVMELQGTSPANPKEPQGEIWTE